MPSDEASALPPADELAYLRAQVATLSTRNAKLERINAALIERVESAGPQSADASYAAFQHSVVLAEQVRERTDALNRAMTELQTSNALLLEARGRAESAHQYLIDAIESISDAFVLFDAEQRLLLSNRRFRAMWATDVEIRRGTPLEMLRRLISNSGLVVETHSDGEQDCTLYRLHDGRWVQVSERATREGGLVILYTDITGVKHNEMLRREQAVAQKSHLLQRTMDNLSQGVAVINVSGELEIWNGRFLELVGLENKPLAHSLFADVMARSEVQLLTPYSRDERGALLREREQRLSDGRVLEIRTHPMPAGGFVNTYTDITERYRYAETLRESERWIRLITDQVPALIAYISRDFTYEFTNKVYDEWYHWPRGAMLGQRLQAVHSAEHCSLLEPYMERALTGENVTFEMAERNQAGQERYMLRSYVPNREPGGTVLGIFVLIRDITERRRTAEALHQAYQNLERRVRERTAELTNVNSQLRDEIDERARAEARLREAKREAEQANLSKTKFLAAVSHDLLQPLNAARLFMGALLEQPFPRSGEVLIRNVSNSLEDVENLLGTLVDVSKLDAGVIKPDISAFAISDLLDTLAAEYQQIAVSEGLRLHFVPCSAIVKSDVQLLARVLRNFLTNAIRYTPAGRVLLGCRRKASGLSIEVWDTGAGIAEERREEIFQEFRRGAPVRTTHDRGLGLGLAIVDKIVRMLGHRIHVYSQVGRGSCFAVEIPYARTVSRSKEQTDSLPIPPSEHLEGARIWVVDNDPAICAGMRTLLEGWGCQVITALSEEDLARQVDTVRGAADILIVDYHLDNDQTGDELINRLNSRRSTPLPVLMITANYSNELKQQIRDHGQLLMHKPVRPMKLKMAMSHLLEKNRGA